MAAQVMGPSREKMRWIGAWYLAKQGVAEEPQAAESDASPITDLGPRGSFSPVELDSEWWGSMLVGDCNFGG